MNFTFPQKVGQTGPYSLHGCVIYMIYIYVMNKLKHNILHLKWLSSVSISSVFSSLFMMMSCYANNLLTLLPLDKMATILQITFQNAFLWMKSSVFLFKFHWCFFRFSWQKVSIVSGYGLVQTRGQAITWSNVDWVHWYIYAALGEMSQWLTPC